MLRLPMVKLPIALLLVTIPASAAFAGTCSTPTFLSSTSISGERGEPAMFAVTDVASADFNSDGQPDLAMAATYGLWIALRDTTSPFNPYPAPQKLDTQAGDAARARVADIDKDGKPDIVFTSVNGNLVTTLLGNGDGTFREKPAMTVASPFAFVIADFNRDGRLDLAVYSSGTPTLTIFRGKGDGTYDTPLVTPLPEARSWLATGDFDGDGKPDLALSHNTAPQIEIRRGNGDGTFAAPVILTIPNRASRIAVADLDGDARPDIVAAVPDSFAMVVLRNTGGGNFASPVSYTTPAGDATTGPVPNPKPAFVTTGDFMRRGRVDVAVGSFTGMMNVFPANGDGTFGAPKIVALLQISPASLTTLDADNDGVADVAVGNVNSGGGIVIAGNYCGVGSISAEAKSSTVSAGAPVQVTAHFFENQSETATGTVTLLEGTNALASAPLSSDGSSATLSATLPAGDHTLTARYDGDATFDPVVSRPFVVHVTTVTTTTHLVVTPLMTDSTHPVSVRADITSSSGDTPAGSYTMLVDGVAQTYRTWDAGTSYDLLLSAGTHVLSAAYNGDASHPASAPSTATVTVARSTPQMTFTLEPAHPATGTPLTAQVTLTVPARWVTGSVFIVDGNVPRGTFTFTTSSTSLTATIPLNGLPAGTRTLTAVYPGDSEFTPVSKSLTVTIPGTPPAPKRRAAPH